MRPHLVGDEPEHPVRIADGHQAARVAEPRDASARGRRRKGDLVARPAEAQAGLALPRVEQVEGPQATVEVVGQSLEPGLDLWPHLVFPAAVAALVDVHELAHGRQVLTVGAGAAVELKLGF